MRPRLAQAVRERRIESRRAFPLLSFAAVAAGAGPVGRITMRWDATSRTRISHLCSQQVEPLCLLAAPSSSRRFTGGSRAGNRLLGRGALCRWCAMIT